ncbi:MAG: hypothetical protein K6C68_06025 [Ruminococcus sp.]|nr:hypothetical protein [Ruminococcus sp.]
MLADVPVSRAEKPKRQLRWMKLDNAAKIYPAARRRNWNNVFRLSVTLKEDVDPEVLQQALDRVIIRFPSIAVRLRHSTFWYYLEEIPRAPRVMKEFSYPLTHFPFDDILTCAFRVLYYRGRIAVEFFHAIADGNGGMIFLKTLAAEYLRLKHGADIPCTDGVLDISEPAREEELRDDFPRYSGRVSAGRREATAYQLKGTPEPDGYRNIIIGELDARAVVDKAHEYGVTITELMAGVMIKAFLDLQEKRVPPKKRRPAKVLIPVNLRRMFPSETLRNFVLYVTPGIDPALGDYSFEEILSELHSTMQLELSPKRMAARIRANVKMEQMLPLKLLPLFVKNIGMKMVYDMTGEKKSCITMSNLGVIRVPAEMSPFIERFGFTLGVQRTSPNNCTVISYGGKLYVTMIRSIEEPVLERRFYTTLRKLGLAVKVESNGR